MRRASLPAPARPTLPRSALPRVVLPLVILPLVGLALLAACASDAPVPEEPGAAAETYDVRGVYHGARFEGAAVSVTHEDIPGVMDAMRMNLRLAEGADVTGLAVGDKVRFTVVVADGRMVARDFERLPDTTTLALPDTLR